MNLTFEKLLVGAKNRDDYWVADALCSFSEQLQEIANNRGMNKVELAQKAGLPKSHLTKIYEGQYNPTLKTLVRLARQAGAYLEINLIPDMED